MPESVLEMAKLWIHVFYGGAWRLQVQGPSSTQDINTCWAAVALLCKLAA